MKLIAIDNFYVRLTNHGDTRMSVGGSVILPGATEDVQYVTMSRKVVSTIENSELEFVGYVSPELTEDDSTPDEAEEVDLETTEDDSTPDEAEEADTEEESVDDFFGAAKEDDEDDELARDELEGLTKDELQDVLREQDKKISGNKDELIDRIMGDGE